MANLTTVREGLADQGWNNPNVVLVKDEDTGQHYAVSTLDSVTAPWMTDQETLVFPTDAEGTVTPDGPLVLGSRRGRGSRQGGG